MTSPPMQALKIAGIYALCSLLWIVFSDRLLPELQTEKGLVFVSLTALLIFFLVHAALRAREKLEQHLNQINRIINRSPVITIAWDNAPGWPVRFVNDTIRQWGHEPRELLEGRLHFADLIHPDDLERVNQEVYRHFSEGPDDYTQEYRIRTASGAWIWVNDRTWLERDAAGKVSGIFGILQDVSDTRAALMRLAESQNRLETLINTIPDLVWMKDPDGLYLSVNRRFESFFGAPRERILGRTDYDFVNQELADFFREHDRKAMEAGGPCINEEWLTFADTGYRGLFETIKTPVRDEQGRLMGVLGISRDITQLREAQEELRSLNIQLEHRVRERTAELEALNRELESFSYSVSHDLKAPLRSIDGYSQLLQEDYKDRLEGDGLLFLANIRKGVGQMQELIEDLLAYSRMERRQLENTPLSLPEVVEQVLEYEAQALGQAGLTVETRVPPLIIRADRDGLGLVLRNLIENAIKFSPGAQPPLIHIEARAENGRVLLSVRDHGIGFDMKYHDRIFKIFQRLHRAEDYPGTGIGLALAAKAMQRMGGSIRAESSPGAGATFYLELPA
ncbi:PAS domain S-box protein [Azovibrio restrictus]|uniref:sensor histidine kinase n=1 Tax=Azovibrio restrictus TaxID=146938 RepID=UPI0026F0560E|nr:PAS domain S-box protein [Azovibrio restrictus]